MRDPFAQQPRGVPDQLVAEQSRLPVDKQMSHQLWNEAKAKATLNGQIDARRALQIFDELIGKAQGQPGVEASKPTPPEATRQQSPRFPSQNEQHLSLERLRHCAPQRERKLQLRRLVPVIVIVAAGVLLFLPWPYLQRAGRTPKQANLPSNNAVENSSSLPGAANLPSPAETHALPQKTLDLPQIPGSSSPGSLSSRTRAVPWTIHESPAAVIAAPSITAPTVQLRSVPLLPNQAAALLVRQIAPNYPPRAQAIGVKGGHVTLRIVVDEQGMVVQAHPVTPNDLLSDAALNAVRLWRYLPYAPNGRPTAFNTTVVVDFSLASPRN